LRPKNLRRARYTSESVSPNKTNIRERNASLVTLVTMVSKSLHKSLLLRKVILAFLINFSFMSAFLSCHHLLTDALYFSVVVSSVTSLHSKITWMHETSRECTIVTSRLIMAQENNVIDYDSPRFRDEQHFAHACCNEWQSILGIRHFYRSFLWNVTESIVKRRNL